MNPNRLRAYTILLIVSLIWGIAGPIIKFTIGGVPPLVFLLYRFAIATAIAIPITLASGIHLPRDSKSIMLLIIFCILTSPIALGLLFLGYEKTTAIQATILSMIGPILVAVAGVLFLKEHITRREIIGIGIAFIGTSISVVEPLLQNHDGIGGLTGNLLILASLFVGVASSIMAKLLTRRQIEPLLATNLSFAIGLITILPLTLLFLSPDQIFQTIRNLPIEYHFGVIYMAVISGTLAYFLWLKAQKTIEIGEAGLFGYLYPLFATPLAVVWLKEKITIPFAIGALITTAGVIIAEYKKKRIKSS